MNMKKKTRLGVLVSGGGTNLQEIIDAIADKRLPDCEIVCVASNNPDAFGLERAANAGIPTFHLPYNALTNLSKKSPGRLNTGTPHDLNEGSCLKEMGLKDTPENRMKIRILATAEVELLNILKKCEVDLLICAGFDRLLSPYFHNKFQPNPSDPRVMNVHPAILPAFPGMGGYKKAWNKGVKIHGITVHFVDTGKDTGPIIAQRSYTVLPKDTLDTFQARGLKLEYDTLWRCIKLFIERRLKVKTGPDGKQLVVETLDQKRYAR